MVILDAWSRRVVGYAIGRWIDTCLTLAALRARAGDRRSAARLYPPLRSRGPARLLVGLVPNIRVPVLLAALVARPWRSHIHRGILLEETDRFEHKAGICNGHHRPVLRPWNMVHAE